MDRRELLFALTLAALSTALYLPTLRHDYTLDDLFIARDNPVVAELRWREAATSPWWPPQHGIDWHAANWRPLATLSLVAERSVSATAVPRLHHLGNALLHGALVLALLPLARRLAGPGWPALAALALFAVHPSHTEAVAPVVGRSDLLGALGALLALAGFLRHRETGSRAALAAGASAFGAGLLGKESAAPILLLLPCADVLLRGLRPRELLAPRSLAAYVPFAAVAALYAAARVAVLGRAALVHGQAEQLGIGERVVFAAHNTAVSLGLLIFPNRFHHLLTTLPTDAPITYPLPTGLAAAGFVTLALAVGTGWLALARRSRPGAFAWLGALVTWLPTSGLLPTGTGTALRFLLLPSAFAACGAARGLAAAVRARPRARPLVAATLAIAVTAETATTLRRTPAWRDNGAFFASVLDESPDCYTALFSLASYLEELPQPDRVRSRALLRRAIEIAPETTHGLEARVNLGSSFLRAGQVQEALTAFAEAIAAAPNRFEPYLYRGLTLQRIGRNAEARADFERVLELNPALPEAAEIRAAIDRAR